MVLGMSIGLFSVSAVQAKDQLTIAIQPTSTPQKLQQQAKELEKFLEDNTGLEIEIFFSPSYAGVIEALRFGHADAAFMGSKPATMAYEKAEAKVVLAEVRDVIHGDQNVEAPFYYSYWVVPKDSPIQSLEELKGKKAAFSSQLSSSGFVAPMSKLVELGFLTKEEGGSVDPNTYFSEVFFAGGYAQAWEALKKGQVDVTVIAGDIPEKLYREVMDNTRILEKQGPIPSHAVVTNKDLDEVSAEKLVSALLGLNDEQYRPLMRKFVSGIFVRFERSGQEHLQSLQKMLKLTGF